MPPKKSMGDSEFFCAAQKVSVSFRNSLCRPKTFCVAQRSSVSPKNFLRRPSGFWTVLRVFGRSGNVPVLLEPLPEGLFASVQIAAVSLRIHERVRALGFLEALRFLPELVERAVRGQKEIAGERAQGAERAGVVVGNPGIARLRAELHHGQDAGAADDHGVQ